MKGHDEHWFGFYVSTREVCFKVAGRLQGKGNDMQHLLSTEDR